MTSAANKFTYCAQQRREIMNAVPLADDVRPDDLLDALSDAAQFCLMLRGREKNKQYAGQIRRELVRLREAYDKLGPDSRDALARATGIDLAGGIELAMCLDDIHLNVPERGRPPNEAAMIFATRCAHLWRKYVGKSPPRRAHPRSPFMSFVETAMPPGLHPESHGAVTGCVRKALERFHRKMPWD